MGLSDQDKMEKNFQNNCNQLIFIAFKTKRRGPKSINPKITGGRQQIDAQPGTNWNIKGTP